jgi:simple sugar transport system permease protein
MLVRFLTLREGSLIVVTLLAILYFSLSTEHFFSHANFINVLPYFAPFAILAAGEVLLMVAGEIDLSIGSVYLFSPFMFYQFSEAGLPLVVDLILALLCCALVGLINGIFVEE